MTDGLPPYVPAATVAARLPLIFPEGTQNRGYCVRELAASTVFAALYVGAVEGSGRLFGPVHVYRMTDEQSEISNSPSRLLYSATVLGKKESVPGRRWYADNTREPIRDETLRDGLVAIGAVTRREDLPTTSGEPRYALRADFAALFDPGPFRRGAGAGDRRIPLPPNEQVGIVQGVDHARRSCVRRRGPVGDLSQW